MDLKNFLLINFLCSHLIIPDKFYCRRLSTRKSLIKLLLSIFHLHYRFLFGQKRKFSRFFNVKESREAHQRVNNINSPGKCSINKFAGAQLCREPGTVFMGAQKAARLQGLANLDEMQNNGQGRRKVKQSDAGK